jgi:hypothetical protein
VSCHVIILSKILKGGDSISRSKKRSLKRIIWLPLSLVAVLGIWKFINFTIGKTSKSKTQLATIKYSDSITPVAYGNFLVNALNSFYKGGGTNGKKIKAHHYYPTTADLKNKNWLKKNLPLGTKVEQLILGSKLVYKPTGCQANKPSSSKNACTSYTITSNGSIIYDSAK